MLIRVTSALGCCLALLVLALMPASGAAPVTCEVRDSRTGSCLIEITVPLVIDPISGAHSGEGNGSGDVPAPTCQNARGNEIPCTLTGFGSWSSAKHCYVSRAEPQPPPTDPIWTGQTTGAIYQCYVPPENAPLLFGAVSLFWSAAPPVAPTLTPEQAAEIVVAGMGLSAVDIGIVPEPGPASVGLVGLPVWMWAQRTPNTWGPLTRTANAGGVTITATARVNQVVWDMGDGDKVTCTTPGTVYSDEYGDRMSPDCGHRYTETSVGLPGDAYPVSATSSWIVDWNGGGRSGQISVELSAQTQIQVGELQVLVHS